MAPQPGDRIASHSAARAARVVAAALLGIAALGAQQNLLVVIADDLGTDAVGCYAGSSAPPTPNIDALAAAGVRFTQAHASPACSPTRAAILTGRYGMHTGITGTLAGGDPGIDPLETLLPTALASSGYARALIGKWHLGTRYGNATPNVLGWPHFVGAIDAGLADYYAWPKVTNGGVATSTRYATTDEVDEALQWIGTRTTPWLCVVAFHAPHQPLHAPPAPLHTQNLAGLSPATTPQPFFRAMVQAMDREFGRLLAGLGPARANTNVVFVADNGTDGAVAPAATGPTRAKGSLYQAGTHVPLIVAGPAVVRPGRVSQALVHAVDLFPTALQLCNVPLPPAGSPRPLDGVSLRPLLADTATSVRGEVYVEITGTPYGGGYAVKDGRYELLRILQAGPQRQELYDLAADPLEQQDLLAGTPSAASEQQRQRLEGRLAALRSDGWVEGYGAACAGPAGTPTLRAQTMPRIGDWIYLQVENAPLLQNGFAIVAWGDSRRQAGPLALPLEMGWFGMPGCFVQQNFVGSEAVSPQTGYLRLWIAPLPALLGAEFFAQAIVEMPGANPANLVGSRGLRVVVGS